MGKKRFMALVPVDAERAYGPANKYDPEYCWTVRELGQEGKFPEEWVSHLGVTLKTLYNWANSYPEFEQAMHEAHWLCRAYWARRARENVQGVGMAPSILALILQRRFGDMWGQNAANLQQHFEDRNRVDDLGPAGIDPERIKSASEADLEEAIRALQERRKIMKGGE